MTDGYPVGCPSSLDVVPTAASHFSHRRRSCSAVERSKDIYPPLPATSCTAAARTHGHRQCPPRFHHVPHHLTGCLHQMPCELSPHIIDARAVSFAVKAASASIARARAEDKPYLVTTANFMVEALKCALSLAALTRIWRNEGVTKDNRVSEQILMTLGTLPLLYRLSTTWNEVNVYPIPTALYLIKNLLQYYIFALQATKY